MAKLNPLKNLDELAASPGGRDIARDFGDHCANMKIHDAVRLARMLADSFQVGKKVAQMEAKAEAKAALSDALKRLS